VLASDIMDSYSPVPSGVRMPQDEFRTWDEAAPLSSGLSMTVLLTEADIKTRTALRLLIKP